MGTTFCLTVGQHKTMSLKTWVLQLCYVCTDGVNSLQILNGHPAADAWDSAAITHCAVRVMLI